MLGPVAHTSGCYGDASWLPSARHAGAPCACHNVREQSTLSENKPRSRLAFSSTTAQTNIRTALAPPLLTPGAAGGACLTLHLCTCMCHRGLTQVFTSQVAAECPPSQASGAWPACNSFCRHWQTPRQGMVSAHCLFCHTYPRCLVEQMAWRLPRAWMHVGFEPLC